MGKIGFGAAHLGMPTPASITRLVTGLSIFIPIFLAWVRSEDNLFGPHATKVIVSLGLLIIALANGAKGFFGVKIDTPVVPTDKVTSIDNSPK